MESPCDPVSGQGFFRTIPIEKGCVCMDSASWDLLRYGDRSPSEDTEGITAFSIFGLWEQRSSEAEESLISLKDLP